MNDQRWRGEGRTGGALAAARFYAQGPARDEYVQPPITVECWARVRNANESNILVAAEPRDSSLHWSLFSDSGTGALCAHFSWCDPFEVKSARNIADDQWHHLALVHDGSVVRLFVDGQQVAEKPIKRVGEMPRVTGNLCVGLEPALTPIYDCVGLIEQVRISRGVRDLSRLQEQFKCDAQTIGLWAFNLCSGGFADGSPGRNALKLIEKPTGSLDEIDRASFKAGADPWQVPETAVRLEPGAAEIPGAAALLMLDGEWELAESGEESTRLTTDWPDAIPANVPGSVHTALRRAGLIPDPAVGLQDAAARQKSFKTWWMRKSFARPKEMTGPVRLSFGGVAVKCAVWLNGTKLGDHEGMFGGPEFEVGKLLEDRNTLIVRIDPAPYEISKGFPNNFFIGMNVGWMRTVVFNNVYGWHYSNIPSLGIWRPVELRSMPSVQLEPLFVKTHDAAKGLINLRVDLRGPAGGFEGKLIGEIRPDNFEGASHRFSIPIQSKNQRHSVNAAVQIPNAKPWWPNDLGEPNLYRLRLAFAGSMTDVAETTFGIRTIEMAPRPGGPNPGHFNWTFVINGRPTFVKGNGWCTMDPLMDFSPERYDRMLSIADQQHVQMVRCWGSGMPETDEFFDLCDRKGIMVMQEWPTAWNSHNWQPFDQLEETVRLNTIRLRNHPSLVMWGGGNESDKPFGEAIDMMGKLSIELDGTRPFHRGEPWGGSRHDYTCWWGRAPLDFNLTLTSNFFGEFGLASLPVYESVQRYLPDHEKSLWPAPPHGSFVHHTPVFNKMQDMDRLLQYSGYFTDNTCMQRTVTGSQLAQATGVRHTLERARTRWPYCTGALYYKMNDNYPAASWSCADWYGAPKIGHYFFQDAFAPLHACVLLDVLDVRGKDASFPVFLLDDVESLSGDWKVIVRAFDESLTLTKSQEFTGSGTAGRVKQLGAFALETKQTQSTPLLIVVEIRAAAGVVDRTFYWLNYEARQDSLFTLPQTSLDLAIHDRRARVTNTGNAPAVGVAVLRPGHLDTFLADDNYFWLDPGETRSIAVNNTSGLSAEAWNCPRR